MKVLVIIFLLLKFSCEGLNRPADLHFAFKNVTRHLFQLETLMFVDNYGVDLSRMTWLILKNLNEQAMPFRLQNIQLNEDKVYFDHSTILTFNTFKKVRAFNDKLELTNEFYKPLQLFVYCQDATIKEIESLAVDVPQRSKKWQHLYKRYNRIGRNRARYEKFYMILKSDMSDIIQYEYFVIEEAAFVKLMTFVWYSPGRCGKLHLVEVNKYSKTKAKWESEKFSMEKLKNFHGCEIVYFQEIEKDGTIFEWIIPQMLETHLNYKLKQWKESKHVLKPVDILHRKGCIDSLQHFFYLLMRKTTNTLRQVKLQYFITHVVDMSPNYLAAPPSEKYSNYEKLKMPFDNYVWTLIALTFVVAYVTILILYRLSQTTRHFVIGSNVRTPSLNVTQIFFGIAQVILPRRNFARFLTMSFILYSLVIRTAWQGKMYEFMQKDIMKPEVQTVEEMIDKGFTFYMEKGYTEKFPNSEITLRGKIAVPLDINSLLFLSYERELEANIYNPKFKGVMQVDPVTIKRFISESEGDFTSRLRKEILHVSMCGLEFPRHHHFAGIYDLKSQQLFSGGIVPLFQHRGVNIYKILDACKEEERRYKDLKSQETKTLTLVKLEPGFVIWTSSLSFALIAYLLELSVTLRNFLVMKYVLLAFYRTKDEFGKSTCGPAVISVEPAMEDEQMTEEIID